MKLCHFFQQKIDTIHEQVIRGELKSVKRMLDKRGWVQVHDYNYWECSGYKMYKCSCLAQFMNEIKFELNTS